MRVLLAATVAASLLALGLGTEPAASLPLGGQGDNPGTPVHKVQQMSPGPGMGGGRMRSGERDMRDRDWRRGDRDRGRYGRRGFEFRPGYGYRADCGWLRRRALDTGSPYWWRRYRDCMR